MSRLMVFLAAIGFTLLAVPAYAVVEGQKAPQFQAPSLRDDSMFDLARYRGKVVYLEFWASWCPNCWDAMPELEMMRSEIREEGLKGFEVIGVNVNDTQADAETAMRQFKVTFPLARPFDDWVMKQYGIRALPYGVLIDQKGIVRAVYLGMSDSDRQELKKKVRRLLWNGM